MLEHGVDRDDAVVPVGDQDGLVAGLEHPGGEPQLVLQPLAAGDVPHHQQQLLLVITSYSIHYTKLYESLLRDVRRSAGR